MHHDLAVPERHGIKQSVGDTVGPGRHQPRAAQHPGHGRHRGDMEAICPDAWLLNITNPMTTLCRAVTRETEIATVGLCHEVTMAQFTLSQLLDADFRAFDLTVTGVNHLPVITGMKVGGEDGFELLRALLVDPDGRGDEPIVSPRGSGTSSTASAASSRSGTCSTSNQVKFSLFERFGVLPAAGDRHLVEFFPGFLTEESELGPALGRRAHVDRGSRGLAGLLPGRVRGAARRYRGTEAAVR